MNDTRRTKRQSTGGNETSDDAWSFPFQSVVGVAILAFLPMVRYVDPLGGLHDEEEEEDEGLIGERNSRSAIMVPSIKP